MLALALSTLNFAAFYLLAKRFGGFGIGASTAGAFLFAFSSPRAVGLNHLQMTAGFFGVAAFAALVAIFAERRGGRGWIALFWLSCLLQLYAGVYHAWFLGFLVALAAAIALTQEHARERLLAELRREPFAWAGGALVVAVAAWPLAAHYLAAAKLVGARPLAVVLQLLPRPESWLNLGPGSLLYGSLTDRFWGPALPFEWTHRLGLGFLTWALVFWGAALALRRREGPLRLLVLAFGLAVLLATRWPGDGSLWRGVYELVPGATAIRAVGRLAVVGLLLLALCLALAWRRLEESRRFRALARADRGAGRPRTGADARDLPPAAGPRDHDGARAADSSGLQRFFLLLQQSRRAPAPRSSGRDVGRDGDGGSDDQRLFGRCPAAMAPVGGRGAGVEWRERTCARACAGGSRRGGSPRPSAGFGGTAIAIIRRPSSACRGAQSRPGPRPNSGEREGEIRGEDLESVVVDGAVRGISGDRSPSW